MRHRVLFGVALVSSWLAAPAAAQIDLTGGPQAIVWPGDCKTSVLLRNVTGLPMAALWVGIGNDGVNNPPEVKRMYLDAPKAKTFGFAHSWDADDNEDLDNDDLDAHLAEKGDPGDSTPTGLASGWHRVQAQDNGDLLPPGETFTLLLCDQGDGSLSGRTVFVLPMAPRSSSIGGDLSRRTEQPFGVSNSAPNGSVSINASGAPPSSTQFSIQITNTDPSLDLGEIEITPPAGGPGIATASASGGGVYVAGPPSLIQWPTPIAPSGTAQVNVELNGLVAGINTTQFQATVFARLASVPAHSRWALGFLFGAVALIAARALARRSA